jgi:probable rRNA maturation factor
MIEIQKIAPRADHIDLSLVKKGIRSTLERLEHPEADVTLRLTGDSEMHDLNRTYRQVNSSTDVLSFTQNVINPETGRLYLGDILISVSKVFNQASLHGHSIEKECTLLAIHGTLHLLGYDHATPEEKDEMWQMQESLLQQTLAEEDNDA